MGRGIPDIHQRLRRYDPGRKVGYKKLNGKWRNIRDSYVRSLRKGYGYMYAKHLSFLNNIYKSTSQSGSDAEQDDNWQSDDDSAKLSNVSFRKSFNIKNCDGITERSVDWQSDGEEIPLRAPVRSVRKRRKIIPEIEYVEPLAEPTCSSTGEDDDRSFFESVLPAVRVFDIDQKLEFRGEVLRLIKMIRYRKIKIKSDPTEDL
ncbi:uncharacterized protein LOC114244913 isoform X2 [Bombyx mandarina]|uniref:BESS domain-containing protein n=2 Tax=Bombyx TaxID=7090 RepID=A0A8R1WLC9_BOMMO|nr:uncharacterized protein LOC101737259 isoform X2 [Bombyx mori]XP_028032686.1 uncharacterized protein LOC114244913 isoform X2 [Bombyx mandarina]